MPEKYASITKYNDLRPAVEQILLDHVLDKPAWTYRKSKQSYVRTISKNASIELSTGFSPKITFVNFQFGVDVTHKLVTKAYETLGYKRPLPNKLVHWNGRRFIPQSLAHGRVTVYLRGTSDTFDAARSEENATGYSYLEEFPHRLAAIFDLAETEIERIFDVSSEQALIRSIVNHPMGTFAGTEALMVNLMLGNAGYYDKLIEFYNQPPEILWEPDDQGFPSNQAFNKEACKKMMETYQKGDFPKFDFV